jgi:hypothetical protein
MPKVGNKEFPYTPKGIKMAKVAAQGMNKRMTSKTLGKKAPVKKTTPKGR